MQATAPGGLAGQRERGNGNVAQIVTNQRKFSPLYLKDLINTERTSYNPKFITEQGGLSRLYKIFSAIRHYARKLPADLCGVYLKNILKP